MRRPIVRPPCICLSREALINSRKLRVDRARPGKACAEGNVEYIAKVCNAVRAGAINSRRALTTGRVDIVTFLANVLDIGGGRCLATGPVVRAEHT